MQLLLTRFHSLLLTVTVAITIVAFLRVPADFAYPAHWSGSTADWLWPRDVTLAVAPLLQVLLLLAFFLLGRALSKNQFSKSQHILDPALTLLMSVIAACQLGFLFTGIGSDIDLVRLLGFGLGAALMMLGIVLYGAERHTYAGLRMPWPVKSDWAWTVVHRATGSAYVLAGVALILASWFDAGQGILTLGFAAALLGPALIAGGVTMAAARF